MRVQPAVHVQNSWGYAAGSMSLDQWINQDRAVKEAIDYFIQYAGMSPDGQTQIADFDGSIVSIKRPLILLNTLGDVNNDKQADTKDVSRIRNRFSADLANNTNVTGYDVGGLLNRYRICDVNKDRAVNLIDANNIRAKKMIQFYTNDGGGA